MSADAEPPAITGTVGCEKTASHSAWKLNLTSQLQTARSDVR